MDRRPPFIVSALAADVHSDIRWIDDDITARETEVTNRGRCEENTTLLVGSIVKTRAATTSNAQVFRVRLPTAGYTQIQKRPRERRSLVDERPVMRVDETREASSQCPP